MVKRYRQTEIYHTVVEHDGVLQLSGTIADDLDSGMEGQTEQILAKIDRLLVEYGSSKEHILSALIFITDMAMKPAMNAAWCRWLPADALPTRATIGVDDLGKGVLIEVVITAAAKK